MKIIEIFNKPKIIAIIGNVNEAKSNLVYYLIREINKFKSNIVTFGLRQSVGGREINSLEELEQIKDSIIFIDEFYSLFDLDNRKKKRMIENTLRLINHNNNALVLTGLPENFKKFICGKLDTMMFKKVTYADFVNGSRAKNVLMSYKGSERGSSLLDLNKNEALVYDGLHFEKIKIPYLKECDTKAKNKPLVAKK